MQMRSLRNPSGGLVSALLAAVLLQPNCGSDHGVPASGGSPASRNGDLTGLLPADTRGALRVELRRLLQGDTAAEIEELLAGRGSDPALVAPFAALAAQLLGIDVADAVHSDCCTEAPPR